VANGVVSLANDLMAGDKYTIVYTYSLLVYNSASAPAYGIVEYDPRAHTIVTDYGY